MAERPKLSKEQEEQLQSYAESMRQEFADARKGVVKARNDAEKELAELVPDAIERMRRLVRHSENDNLAFKASKFVIESVLSEKGIAKKDPMEEFLEDMPAADAR